MEKPNKKTGTTTIAMKYKDGVLLAADRQSTIYNSMVYSTKEFKLIKITDKISVAGAGSSAEIELLTKALKAEMKIFEVRNGRKPTVTEVANLLSRIQSANSEASFLLGGVDDTIHVFDIDANYAEERNYTTSGSGFIFAMSILDDGYKDNLTEKEATDLAIKAISTSIGRDVYSSGGITTNIITKNGTKETIHKENKTNANNY